MRRPRDWSFDTPAYDEQGYQSNQDDLRQAAQKGFAPNAHTLRSNVSRVMNNGQGSQEFIWAVQRQDADVHRLIGQSLKCISLTVFLQGHNTPRGSFSHLQNKIGGDDNHFPWGFIAPHADQFLAIGET